MTVVDAHLHLWNLERSAYAWTTPAGTWHVLSALIGELTADDQQKILAGTACRVYRLGSVSTNQPITPEAPC